MYYPTKSSKAYGVHVKKPAATETLADFIDDEVEVLSVGLNPSPNSVRCGYPFATPQNRFWSALNRSRLGAGAYPAGIASMRRLLTEDHIGFTDVVKRPTRGASDLRARDFREWVPILNAKIERYRPLVVWFHGKVAYRNYVRYGTGYDKREIDWGGQSEMCGGAAVFVTPNPSPANAVYSLADIIEWFDRLADFKRELSLRVP